MLYPLGFLFVFLVVFMTKRVLIIGGYGNFGGRIAGCLAQEETIQIIVAGRSGSKARAFVQALDSGDRHESAVLDIDSGLERSLAAIDPDIVIHTSGPFQARDYGVAMACIAHGCHYIDLADARSFVTGITQLDGQAKEKNILLCSGASSVPCLTSALVDSYQQRFSVLERIEYGITTAQLTNRGLATTQAVLSYAGKSFKTLVDGRMQDVYGWHDLQLRRFWGVNRRLLGNCDISDLDLFPQRYPQLQTIRFKAGLELKIIHLGLWFLAWLVRMGLVSSLEGAASRLLKLSRLFDFLGGGDSGFYMHFYGKDEQGRDKELVFDLVARQGDGSYIPCIPAVLMARKLANGEITRAGAFPCVGFITIDEYLDALSKFDIHWK